MKKIVLFILGLSFSIGLFAQVSKTLNVTTSGTLYSLLSAADITNITNLTLTGKLDARDFVIIRDSLKKLDTLDISNISIEAYSGSEGTDNWSDFSDWRDYDANQLPFSAFDSDTAIYSIILPKTITSIGSYALYSCVKVTKVNIPSTVTEIGNGSFSYCEVLDTIDIPSSVKTIGENAFSSCYELKKVTLPSTITTIRESTFDDCEKLNSIIIPSTVTSIGESAFSTCFELSTITIPTSVDSIFKDAFYSCTSLKSIIIPSSVKYIGIGAFSNCNSLESIVLPSSIKIIEDKVFYGCDSLKTVTIPSSITSIGYESFYDCDSLKSIIIPNSVISIGESAFNDCSFLNTATIPSSVKSIGDYAFAYCDSLRNVVIPSSVTYLGIGSFKLCSSITSITIPSSISSINTATFYSCDKLETITIPSSIDTIGYRAFESCSSLKSVYLPSSITFIDENAFKNCSSLEAINIPNSVDTIGYNAFGSDYLKVLKAFTGPQIHDANPLTGDTLYIPVGTKAAYENSGNYDFKYIIEFEACVASANLIKVPGQGIMPAITFKADTTICPGQNLTIKAPVATSYAWNTKATTQSLKVSETGTYSVTITAPNGCTNSASEHVTFHQPYAEQIKLATFNKANNAVIIAWTPTKGKQIASYCLQLLDDLTGKYKTISKRGLSDSTYVVDKKADVKSQTYSYRLIAYDSVCNDSAISNVHETIHLSCSQSTNASTEVQLSWNTYKGLTPDVYKIYAINNGIAVDSFSLANNGNQTFQRTYSNHKAGNTYRIGFDLASPVITGTLKSDSGPYSQSLSNLAESELTALTNEEAAKIEIYPNPATTSFSVSINEPATVDIYSITSQLIFSKTISSNENVSLEGIAVGTYIVKIKTNDAVITRSLVVEK